MFRFTKFPPTTYVLLYKNGHVVLEGPGLSFWYFYPTSTLVAVPVVSVDMPFIFEEVSSDYQTLTIQGQVTYRIAEPKKIASLLNYALDRYARRYVSNDPDKLSQRVSNMVNVLTRRELGTLTMKDAMKSTEYLVNNVSAGLKVAPETAALGLEILGLAILAVKPAPETARALEAQTRERILQEADEALFARRNSAVDLERSIKENELKTQISVEQKNLQIREAELDKDRVVQERKQAMRDAENVFLITQEQRRSELVRLASANAREESDARAYGMQTMVNAVSGVDPRILQSLAVSGMKPQALIALAFQGLAEKAEKIGNLNITPELLSGLMEAGKGEPKIGR